VFRSAPDGGAHSCDDACVQRLLPGPVEDVTDEQLVEAYEFPVDRPWVRGSLVVSLDGAVAGADGSSRSIASPSDRRVFSVLRLRADVVLVGAGTLRADRYGPSRLPIAVVTRRMDLSPELPLFAESSQSSPRNIVFTTTYAAALAPAWLVERAEVIACGTDSVDLAGVVADLHRRGLGRVHCEGGPSLLSSLVVSNLVDELLITVTPMIVGAPPEQHLLNIPSGLLESARWSPAHILSEDGTVFLRLRRS
jgi:riboflavin biosynthesis pyrimidine reductase